jgi:diguanylate cyclase (GGDEF)-like protein
LDNFKWINDSYGHDIGDIVLKFFANTLKNCLRKGDVVARIGGDEFAVLLPEVKNNSASIVAEKFLKILEEEFIDANGKQLKLSASIGITNSYDAGVSDYDSIFKRADIALYRAKEAGKSRFDFFSDDLHDIYVINKKMADALKLALKNDEFFLIYQPIVDIRENVVVDVETLLRWKNSELGLKLPSEFISILEENRLIHNVGLWIIESVCKEISELKNSNNSINFFTVNISAIQLERNGFSNEVCEILDRYQIDKNSIVFEIKENLYPRISKDYKSNLLGFSKNNLKLAMDNFGTSLSSASYFGETNFNTLKIGVNLLKNVNHDENKAKIVKGLIEFAEKISIQLIAEHVETEDQVKFLKDNGCRLAQGYYFYKPQSIEELSVIMKND